MIHPHATALDRALAEQDAYVEAKLTGAPHDDALALAREDAFRRYEHRRVGTSMAHGRQPSITTAAARPGPRSWG